MRMDEHIKEEDGAIYTAKVMILMNFLVPGGRRQLSLVPVWKGWEEVGVAK